LAGGANFYSYVSDTNGWIDVNGLSGVPDFDALKDMAGNKLDFSTAKDGSVFWSSNDKTSNMRQAQDWALKNGKTMLEQTKGGKYLNDLDLFNPKSGFSGAQAAEV
jgi:hypothetical protein